MSDFQIDALDRALIDALGISPRASWEALGRILDTDANTLARRWRRMTAAGAARICVEPGPARARWVAVLEIECAPSALRNVGAQLEAEEAVVLWDRTTGGRDIVAIVAAEARDTISRLIADRLVTMPGVRSARVAFADSRVHGRQGGFDSLSPEQTRAVHALPGITGALVAVTAEVEREMTRVLQRDPRAPWHQIAEATGRTPHRARSALFSLLTGGRLQFRMRLASWTTHDAVTAWLFAKADPRTIDRAVDALRDEDVVRFVAAVHGRFDLLVCLRLPDMNALSAFIDDAARSTPGIRYIDRSVVLESSEAAAIGA